MKTAFSSGEALAGEIRQAQQREDAFRLWWLGQSGFLVKWNGRVLLFDPYLSDSLTEKYAATDKPHVRISERVIAPELLDLVDVVTSSHNHTDHLDADTLVPLSRVNPGLRMVLPEANKEFASKRLGNDCPELIGIDDGTSAEVAGFRFTGVAAAHNSIDRDTAGRCLYLGFIVEFGPFRIYHSGDTLWHDGLVAALRRGPLDLALVPINGNKPERRVAGNLNGTEAAALAKATGARLAIPHHYDMFEFNTASPEEFTTACERLGQPCRVLRGGESTTISAQNSVD